MNAKDILTPQEVADMLKVSVDTLETWRAKRKGPSWLRLGDSKQSPIRYRREDVDGYLKAREE